MIKEIFVIFAVEKDIAISIYQSNDESINMAILRTKAQQAKRQALFQMLRVSGVVVVATLLIVLFLPRTSGLNYSYELGQPWRYGALISTQKFNIQMSDSDLSKSRDSLERTFMPYFTKDVSMGNNVKESLNSLSTNDELKRKLALVLDTIYERGVISGEDFDSLSEKGTTYIRIIGGNIANVVALDYPQTVHQAYKYIISNPLFRGHEAELGDMNINTILAENLKYEDSKSQQELLQHYENMTSSLGFVRVNEKIIDRGEIVTSDIYQKLKSYDKVIEEMSETNVSIMSPLLWGQIVMVMFILIALASYLKIFRFGYYNSIRYISLIYLFLTFMAILASLMVSRHFFHIFILPCCMVPIVVRVFADSRTGFVVHVATVMLISLALSQPYDFIILQLVAGMIAIFNLKELTQRSQIIHTAIIVMLTYALFYTAYQFATGAELKDVDYRSYIYFAINGFLLLLTYPLFWVIEKLFGMVSDVTLVELSNTNNPLLQQMSSEAPGTFQHSMQVANLASEAAKRVGAKIQLVRTGALYHDIGKLERPVFFTENQAGGNPHDHLSPQKSAEVIISHVTKGLQLAERNNLPTQIKDFIRTHHGNGKVKYFLITYKNGHPDESVDESLFQYPGPNPMTKEQAILMMADAVEAASRSLKEYTEDSISQMVDRIVDAQVSEGYFSQCAITFQDIFLSKEVFKERLRIMYHTRISYPELKK